MICLFNNAFISVPMLTATADKTIEDMFNTVEYFSVSNNDYASKRLMVSDAYPNQKKKFAEQGLFAVKMDMNHLFSCYPPDFIRSIEQAVVTESFN